MTPCVYLVCANSIPSVALPTVAMGKGLQLYTNHSMSVEGPQPHCKYIASKKATFQCLLFSVSFQCIFDTQEVLYIQVFKLADRMRSIGTNGASKNRDWPDVNGVIYKLRRTRCYFDELCSICSIWIL